MFEKSKTIRIDIGNSVWPFVLFLMVATSLLFVNWVYLSNANFETSDFAANSLLIQDAKSLHLWVGNYSRCGFNHPGPAILYVLTLGEVIFYDYLHWVKSPINGQFIAMILYNSFWIAMIFKLLYRTVNSSMIAYLAIAAFLFTVSLFDPAYFESLWFPHLYFFPFALMLIALSRVTLGYSDSLVLLAISSGFLINGHASFVPFLGVMYLIALLHNKREFQNSNPEQYLLSTRYLEKNKSTIVLSLIISSLFLIPLLVESIRHFPGPIYDYIRYGRRQYHSFSMYTVIKFIATYWGGVISFLTGFLVMFLLYKMITPINYTIKNIRSFILTLSSATIALFFYAKYGVDSLEYKYVAYFYQSVPAFLVAIIGIVLIHQLKIQDQFKKIAAFTAGTVLMFATLPNLKIPIKIEDAALLNQNAEKLYQALLSVAQNNQRVVLDLEHIKEEDWGFLWTNIVQLENYIKRHHEPIFCVNENWHILFTKAARCTPQEINNNPRYLVRVSKNSISEKQAEFEGSGLSFIKHATLES